jgi:mRNA interferase RelE/StbE
MNRNQVALSIGIGWRIASEYAIDVIAQNPHLDSHIKKLKGDLKHMHRFRMGDLRILYEIDDEQETVWIKTIEWRGSAYK